ncbi:MAG: rod shape-determining protein MreC [Burkholderiaceae bacterium]|nr:rod shape-determining protein MreC [Burkholderiaceae bacterium]
MPLGTLDRSPPPFFRQGPSALTRLAVCGALALFLMVADARLQIARPVRTAVATVLYPLQLLVMQPVALARGAGGYFASLEEAQRGHAQALERLASQAMRAGQVEELTIENTRLRQLLALREQSSTPAHAAEVLYDAADPYSRKIFIDKGSQGGIVEGSAVMDESGVLGQVTHAHPFMSEVTLVVDRDLSIPVLNARTGVRSIAFGEPGIDGGVLELRFVAPTADVQEGDLITTSGVDGVYPPGLPVARIARVERRADSAFARIYAAPLALVSGARYVLVLDPVGTEVAARVAETRRPVNDARPPARQPARKASQP